MAGGETFHCHRTVLNDERTGREVWKMTSWADAHCVATYMYMQAFSADERYLCFASDRSGAFEFYRLEIETGETVQITDFGAGDQAVGIHCNVHPNGREVCFRAGNTYYAADFDTLDVRPIARLSNPYATGLSGNAMFNGDGRFLSCFCAYEDGTSGVLVAQADGSLFEEVYHWAETERRLQHVQAANLDELVITFALYPDFQNKPEGGPERRARAWKLDVASAEARPFLCMPPGFRATHEYWGPRGVRRLFFHKKTVPEWTPTWISSISIDGDDYEEHYRSDDRPLGHSCVSADLKRLVTDVQDPEGNELILVDMESGEAETLCWPDSSVLDGKVGHVHPSFSPSGSKVLFTSDREGKAAVYIVPLI